MAAMNYLRAVTCRFCIELVVANFILVKLGGEHKREVGKRNRAEIRG